MSQFRFITGAFTVLLAGLLLTGMEIQKLHRGNLRLDIFDIGQGDAILATTPAGQHILIDGGPNTDLLEDLGERLPFFDRTIELLILSHPDADHITALPEVLQRYRVKNILLTGAAHGSGRYEALLAAIEAQGSRVLLADSTQDIELDSGVMLDVLWPQTDLLGREVEAANNESVVAKLIYGPHEILLTGDIEKETELALLQSGADLRSTVLKVAHHGSRTSSSTGFLLAVQPQLGLISSGRDNQFGHPHPEIIERYRQLGIETQNTQQSGRLTYYFD